MGQADSVARTISVAALSQTTTSETITVAQDVGGVSAGDVYTEGELLSTIINDILSAPAKDIKVYAFANTALPTGTTSSPFVLSDDWAVDTTTKAIVSAVGFAQHINAGVIESGTAKAQYVCFAVPNDDSSLDPWGKYTISKWTASGLAYDIPHTGPIPAYNVTEGRNFNLFFLDYPSYDSDVEGIDYLLYITSTS